MGIKKKTIILCCNILRWVATLEQGIPKINGPWIYLMGHLFWEHPIPQALPFKNNTIVPMANIRQFLLK
jgi:hypothetical protein